LNRPSEEDLRHYAIGLLVIGLAGGSASAAPSLPVAATSAPLAATMPEGTYTYVIRHATLGKIGTHVATFRRDGGDTVVDVRIDLDVRLAFMRLYRFVSTGHEVWRDGRLIELETVTNDDGRPITVSARAAGGKLVIDGPAGRSVADADLNTTHLWNSTRLMVSQLVEPTSGNVYSVDIVDRGEERIVALDHWVTSRKFTISGEVTGDLWYGEDGTWLQFDFIKNGSTLRLALVSVQR
jgi:hypothetical protein